MTTTVFTLPRTGMMPITFSGELIGSVSGRELPKWERRERWHELSLYVAASGRVIVHCAFRTTSKYEVENDQVRTFENIFDAVRWLWGWHETESCIKCVQGWRLERHQHRDAALRRELTNQFGTLVKMLVAMVPQTAANP